MERRFTRSFGLLAVIFLAVIALWIITVDAEGLTITVDDDGDADYNSIQQAIDNSNHGDVIQVFDGMYEEDVDVTKAVDIIGNGSEAVQLKMDEYSGHVRISYDNATFSGFCIVPSRNAEAVSIRSNNTTIYDILVSPQGRNPRTGVSVESSRKVILTRIQTLRYLFTGIEVMDSENVSIHDCTISHTYLNGMIIKNSLNVVIMGSYSKDLSYRNLQIINSSVHINDIDFEGRIGIDVLDCSDKVSIYHCDFYETTVAIRVNNSGHISLVDCHFYRNEYGVIINNTHKIILVDCVVQGNDHGLSFDTSSEVVLEDCLFTDATGAAISSNSSAITKIIRCRLSRNTIGIMLEGDSTISSMFNSMIIDNSEHGIDARGNSSCNASMCWWGSNSGPYHPTSNPNGTGNGVTGNVTFHPWTTNLPPNPRILITDSLHPPRILNNGSLTEVFYEDVLDLLPEIQDEEGDRIISYNWSFGVVGEAPMTYEHSEWVPLRVGIDHLYQRNEEDTHLIPKPNSDPVDYFINLTVLDEYGNSGHNTTIIRVHAPAYYSFTHLTKRHTALLLARGNLTWRGFEQEAAVNESSISSETPVFVHIDETISPDPNLENRGGIGNVYDIRVVGSETQSGEEGFIDLVLSIPILQSDLEEASTRPIQYDQIKLHYYDQVEKRWTRQLRSYYEKQDGNGYVVGEVEREGMYVVIYDVYDPWNPSPPAPDLSVEWISFSRSPALNGQEVEVRVWVRNLGLIHAKNVDIKIYDGDDLIGDQRISMIEASGGEFMVKETFTVTKLDDRQQFEYHYIKAFVNKQRAINEGPQNYKNNENQELLVVTTLLVKGGGYSERTTKESLLPVELYIHIVSIVILFEVLIVVMTIPNEEWIKYKKL